MMFLNRKYSLNSTKSSDFYSPPTKQHKPSSQQAAPIKICHAAQENCLGVLRYDSLRPLLILPIFTISSTLVSFFLQYHALPTLAVSCWQGTGDKTELDLLMDRQTTRNRWLKCVTQRSTTSLPCPSLQCSLMQGIKAVSSYMLSLFYVLIFPLCLYSINIYILTHCRAV